MQENFNNIFSTFDEPGKMLASICYECPATKAIKSGDATNNQFIEFCNVCIIKLKICKDGLNKKEWYNLVLNHLNKKWKERTK
jgi:hypothetical protein